MDALNFQLVQYDTFYGGQINQNSSQCLMMLIKVIKKGSVPYCDSHNNNNNCTGVSLSEISFSFMLEKYIVCDACGLRSPSFESSGVLYITSTYTSSMQELIMQGMQQKCPAFDVKKTLGMSNLTIFYSLQSICLLLLIGLDT